MCNYTSSTGNIMLQHYMSVHDLNISDKEFLKFVSEKNVQRVEIRCRRNEKNHFIYYKGKETTADGKSKLTFRCFGDGLFK